MASAIIVVVIFVLLALAILFICQNGGGACSDIEFTLAQTVASFLGKQMES